MIRDVKLQQLRYFLLVAELQSYHAAAERAARTQPAISLAIRELEHRLGETLFERGNKTELTPFGHQCYPQVRGLLAHYDRVVEQMALAAERRLGRVALACVPSFASRVLPSILEQFAGRYPEIQLSVEDDTAHNVQQRVLQQRVDFGVSSLWEADPNLDFEPILTDRMGLVCRRDHPLAMLGRPLVWADLEGQKLITNGTVRLLDGTAAKRIMDQAHFSVSNVISLLATLRAGIGITTLPRLALGEGDPELCFRPLGEPDIERPIGVLRTRRQSLSPAARALQETIREVATTHAPAVSCEPDAPH